MQVLEEEQKNEEQRE